MDYLYSTYDYEATGEQVGAAKYVLEGSGASLGFRSGQSPSPPVPCRHRFTIGHIVVNYLQ